MNKAAEQTLTGTELCFVDPNRLVERLNRHFEVLEITASGYIPKKITWWDELKAGYHEREIEARGRYKLTQTVYCCPFIEKDAHLGQIFVEKGILPDSESPDDSGDYERIVLSTRRELTLKNGIVVPPTKIEIIAEGVSEYYSKRYRIKERKDRHPDLAEAVKTHWFLSAYFRKALKEQGEDVYQTQPLVQA